MKQSIYTLCLIGLLLPINSSAFDMSSPPDSLVVDTTGNVGVGTATPQSKLDVLGDISTTFTGVNNIGLVELLKMSVDNTNPDKFSDAGFKLENAREGFSWAFRTLESTGGFAASKQGTGAKEFEIRNPTNVGTNVELHLANGGKNIGGQWLNASSRSYKENINELSSADAMQALKELKSVTYEFKRDTENTQRVGFIAEDVPALLATKDRKTVDSLQIISVLTKAVQVIQAEVSAKDQKIAEMEAKLLGCEKLQQRVDQMEDRMISMTIGTLKANQQITALNRE